MKLIVFILSLFLSFYLFASIKIDNSTLFDLRTKKTENLVLDESKKFRVFYFLSASCPCVQSHFSHLNEMIKTYPQFQFIGFHSNKDLKIEGVITHYQQFKINFPIYDDQQLVFANKFKALKTPHVFILNQEGKTVFQGGVTNSRSVTKATKFYLRDAMDDLSQGKEPKVKFARVLGCYIER